MALLRPSKTAALVYKRFSDPLRHHAKYQAAAQVVHFCYRKKKENTKEDKTVSFSFFDQNDAFYVLFPVLLMETTSHVL